MAASPTSPRPSNDSSSSGSTSRPRPPTSSRRNDSSCTISGWNESIWATLESQSGSSRASVGAVTGRIRRSSAGGRPSRLRSCRSVVITSEVLVTRSRSRNCSSVARPRRRRQFVPRPTSSLDCSAFSRISSASRTAFFARPELNVSARPSIAARSTGLSASDLGLEPPDRLHRPFEPGDPRSGARLASRPTGLAPGWPPASGAATGARAESGWS